MTHTNFKNLDDKTQGTIDKTLTTINSIWHTWFPSNTTTGGTTNTGGTGENTGGTHTAPPPPPPPPPTPTPTKSYKGLIYAGVGIGVLAVGFLIYKKIKK
jgi:hypothetical protein